MTDARLLYVAGNNGAWRNVPGNGYFVTNSFGETVFKLALPSGALSVFASSSSLTSGSLLIEPRGLAVDGSNNVYCSAWYSKANMVTNDSGAVYRFSVSGVRQASVAVQNPSVCCYDPSGLYAPAATSALIGGPGVLHTGNGIQDFWWTAANGAMSARAKVLDLGLWRDYLDAEVVDGLMWYTDPEYGVVWRRAGDALGEVVATGLGAPTYLASVYVDGPEPPPAGSVLTLR